jgi:selenocysteine lyase/cysteine desulfurase
MISKVTTEASTWNQLPLKFEAGTPDVGGVIGLGEAVAFLQGMDREEVLRKDIALSKKFLNELKKNKNIQVFVDGLEDWIGIISFHHSKIHPHDIAALLDSENVCVRAGHHCAQPLMTYLKVPATTRISPYLYNDERDLEKFLVGLHKVEALLGH